MEKEVHIFGDSHCKCFGRDRVSSFRELTIFNNYVSSASARGLSNEFSNLGEGGSVIRSLEKMKKGSVCVFKYGQVDIEYNYYYKKHTKKDQISKDCFFLEVIDSYVSFVKDVSRKFPEIKLLICGVNVPNVYNLKRYIKRVGVSLPKEVEYKDRFQDHCLFNSELKARCEENGIKYFDLTDETTHDGRLTKEFIGKDNHFSGAEMKSVINENTYNVFLTKLYKQIN